MQPFKIQLKLGQFEFSAEGEEATVKDQLASFMEFVNKTPSQIISQSEIKDPSPMSLLPMPILQDHASTDLGKILIQDKETLSLRIHPEDSDKGEVVRKSMLLLLHGFKTLLQQEDVGAIVIAESLRKSGVTFLRLGDLTDPLLQEGFITKMGKAKGVRYRITNKGTQKMTSIIDELRTRF